MSKIDITTISIFGKSETGQGFAILLEDKEKAAIIDCIQALHGGGTIKGVEVKGLDKCITIKGGGNG